MERARPPTPARRQAVRIPPGSPSPSPAASPSNTDPGRSRATARGSASAPGPMLPTPGRASGILPGGRMKRLSPGPRAGAQPKDQEAAGDPQDDGRRNRAGRLPGSPGGSQQLPIQRLRGARGGGKRHWQGRDGRGGSRGGGRRGSDGGHRRRRCGRGGCRCGRSGGRRHGHCGGRGRGGGSGSRDCRHGPPGPARLLRPGRETQARARGSRAPALGSPGAPEPIGVDDPLFGWIIGATPMRLGLADLSRSATSGGRTGHSVDMEGFLRLL